MVRPMTTRRPAPRRLQHAAQQKQPLRLAAARSFAQPVQCRLGIARRIASAKLPTEYGEFQVHVFENVLDKKEHVALVCGDISSGQDVLVRVHSQCLTGDVFHSLRCDCRAQLEIAMREVSAAGRGIVLYEHQEGRGIGLMNKLRAYRLQDEGFDTMEANQRLGFADDERLYDIAAQMLKLLGYGKVRLLTNNPDKMRALEAAGIAVTERVPHSFPDNEHNRDYLRVKADKGGHLL